MPVEHKEKLDLITPTKDRPSLTLNAISNWTSLVLHVAIGFFLTPFIIRTLGKSGYGIWTLVTSLVGYYGLLNLGVGTAINRYIARYTAQQDDEALNHIASTALVMFCFTGLLAAIFSFVFAESIAKFFEVKPENIEDFKRLVRLIGLTTGISFPSHVFGAIVNSREHFTATNIVSIVQILLRTALTVALLQNGFGLTGLGISDLLTTTFGLAVYFVIFKIYASDIRITLAYANRRTLKKLIIYGGITTVIIVADIVRINFDSIVIGKFVNLDAIGVYGVAALIIRYIVNAITSGMRVLIPRFSYLDGAGQTDQLKKLFLRSLNICAFLAFGAGMLSLIFGGRFIVLWVGREFIPAIPVLLILSIAYAFALCQNPAIGLMYALKKHYIFAAATIVEATANLILSIILAPKYGINGVALGTAIPMIIVKVFIQPLYVARIIKLPVWTYVKPFILPLLLSSLTLFVAQIVGFNRLVEKCNIFQCLILGAVAGILFIGIGFILSLTTGARLLTLRHET